MGNNNNLAQSIASLEVCQPPRKGQWQPIGSTQYCHILKNVENGVLSELYSIPRDGRISMVDDISRYEYRRTQNDNLVRVFQVEKERQRQICQGVERLRVKTERIPLRLSEVTGLQPADGLYILHESLIGYKTIYQHDGPVNINDDMIGFTPEGKVKVWLNENFAKNLQQPESLVFVNRAIKQGNPEAGFVSLVFHVVEEHLQGRQFPGNFRSSYDANQPKSFVEAINFVRGYVTTTGIQLPGRLPSQILNGTVTQVTSTSPQVTKTITQTYQQIQPTMVTSSTNPLNFNLRPATEIVSSKQELPTVVRSLPQNIVIPQQQIVSSGSIGSQGSTSPKNFVIHRNQLATSQHMELVGSFAPVSKVQNLGSTLIRSSQIQSPPPQIQQLGTSLPIRTSVPQINIVPPSKILVNNLQPNQIDFQLGKQTLRVPDMRKQAAFRPSVQILKPQTTVQSAKTISLGGNNRPYTPVFTFQPQGIKAQATTTTVAPAMTGRGIHLLQHHNNRGVLTSPPAFSSERRIIGQSPPVVKIQQQNQVIQQTAIEKPKTVVIQQQQQNTPVISPKASVIEKQEVKASVSSSSLINGSLNALSDKLKVKVYEGKTIVHPTKFEGGKVEQVVEKKQEQVQNVQQQTVAVTKQTQPQPQAQVVTQQITTTAQHQPQQQVQSVSFRGLPHLRQGPLVNPATFVTEVKKVEKVQTQVQKAPERKQVVTTTTKMAAISKQPQVIKTIPSETKIMQHIYQPKIEFATKKVEVAPVVSQQIRNIPQNMYEAKGQKVVPKQTESVETNLPNVKQTVTTTSEVRPVQDMYEPKGVKILPSQTIHQQPSQPQPEVVVQPLITQQPKYRFNNFTETKQVVIEQPKAEEIDYEKLRADRYKIVEVQQPSYVPQPTIVEEKPAAKTGLNYQQTFYESGEEVEYEEVQDYQHFHHQHAHQSQQTQYVSYNQQSASSQQARYLSSQPQIQRVLHTVTFHEPQPKPSPQPQLPHSQPQSPPIIHQQPQPQPQPIIRPQQIIHHMPPTVMKVKSISISRQPSPQPHSMRPAEVLQQMQHQGNAYEEMEYDEEEGNRESEVVYVEEEQRPGEDLRRARVEVPVHHQQQQPIRFQHDPRTVEQYNPPAQHIPESQYRVELSHQPTHQHLLHHREPLSHEHTHTHQPIVLDQHQDSQIVYDSSGHPLVYKTQDVTYQQDGQLIHDQVQTVYRSPQQPPIVYHTEQIVYEENGQIVHEQRETLYDQQGEQMVYESQEAVYENQGQIVTEHHEQIDYQDESGEHHVEEVVYDVNEGGVHTRYYQAAEAVEDQQGGYHEERTEPVRVQYVEQEGQQQYIEAQDGGQQYYEEGQYEQQQHQQYEGQHYEQHQPQYEEHHQQQHEQHHEQQYEQYHQQQYEQPQHHHDQQYESHDEEEVEYQEGHGQHQQYEQYEQHEQHDQQDGRQQYQQQQPHFIQHQYEEPQYQQQQQFYQQQYQQHPEQVQYDPQQQQRLRYEAARLQAHAQVEQARAQAQAEAQAQAQAQYYQQQQQHQHQQEPQLTNQEQQVVREHLQQEEMYLREREEYERQLQYEEQQRQNGQYEQQHENEQYEEEQHGVGHYEGKPYVGEHYEGQQYEGDHQHYEQHQEHYQEGGEQPYEVQYYEEQQLHEQQQPHEQHYEHTEEVQYMEGQGQGGYYEQQYEQQQYVEGHEGEHYQGDQYQDQQQFHEGQYEEQQHYQDGQHEEGQQYQGQQYQGQQYEGQHYEQGHQPYQQGVYEQVHEQIVYQQPDQHYHQQPQQPQPQQQSPPRTYIYEGGQIYRVQSPRQAQIPHHQTQQAELVEYHEEGNIVRSEEGEPIGYEIHETAQYNDPEGGHVVVEDNYQVIEGEHGQVETYEHHQEVYSEEGGVVEEHQQIIEQVDELHIEAEHQQPATTITYTETQVINLPTTETTTVPLQGYKLSNSIGSTLVGSTSNSYSLTTGTNNYGSYGLTDTYKTSTSGYVPSYGSIGTTSSYENITSSYPSYQPEYKATTSLADYNDIINKYKPAEPVTSGLTFGSSSYTTSKYDVSNLTYGSSSSGLPKAPLPSYEHLSMQLKDTAAGQYKGTTTATSYQSYSSGLSYNALSSELKATDGINTGYSAGYSAYNTGKPISEGYKEYGF